jgi:26S proteasome regulatory subunit N11
VSIPIILCIFVFNSNICLDIEDVGQELIEDNIVAVSRQMIDKESSVARVANGKKTENGQNMDVDDEL